MPSKSVHRPQSTVIARSETTKQSLFRLLRYARNLRDCFTLALARVRNDEAARNDNCAAFTYIEILISLAVIAVLFIPMTQLFSHAIYSVSVSGEVITAVNLARWEMEKVKNLNITKSGLKKIGDVWTPKLDEPPLEMNQSKWRILRHINPDSDPLEVRVEVYRADDLNKPVSSAVTLIEDNIWI